MNENAKLTRHERKVLFWIAFLGLLGLGIIAGALFLAHESLKPSNVEAGETSSPEASAYRITIETPPPPASANDADTIGERPVIRLGDQSYAFDELNTQELRERYDFVNVPPTVIDFRGTDMVAFNDATCADS